MSGGVRRISGARWITGLALLALTASSLPAMEMARRQTTPGTPAAVAGAPPVERPLPETARSNVVRAKRAPVVPPAIRAAGKPRALTAAELAKAPKPAPPEQPDAR